MIQYGTIPILFIKFIGQHITQYDTTDKSCGTNLVQLLYIL